MKILLYTDVRNPAALAEAGGIRDLFAQDRRFISRTADLGVRRFPGLEMTDVVLVCGISVFDKTRTGFWELLSKLRLVPVILWGVGCPSTANDCVDPGIVKTVRPRIIAACAIDDAVNEIYGLNAEIVFPSAFARLAKYGKRVPSTPGHVSFVQGPGSSGPSADLRSHCDRIIRWSSPSPLSGFSPLYSAIAGSGLIIVDCLETAVISASLGIPFIGLNPGPALRRFCRRFEAGRLADSEDETIRLIGQYSSSRDFPATVRPDTVPTSAFAEKIRRLIYESLIPQDLGACVVRR